MRKDVGHENVCYIHVTLVLARDVKELKTSHSQRQGMKSIGIRRTRSSAGPTGYNDDVKDKSLFCDRTGPVVRPNAEHLESADAGQRGLTIHSQTSSLARSARLRSGATGGQHQSLTEESGSASSAVRRPPGRVYSIVESSTTRHQARRQGERLDASDSLRTRSVSKS